MRIKNKKAQAGELIQDMVGLIFIVFLLIIFFVISNALWGFSSKEIKIIATEQSINNQEHYSLHSFLQKTIEIEKQGKKQEITIADLVRLSKISSEYQTYLDQEIEKAFSPLYIYKFSDEVSNTSFYIPSNKIITTKLKIESIKE